MLELTLTITASVVAADYPKAFIEKYVRLPRLPDFRFALSCRFGERPLPRDPVELSEASDSASLLSDAADAVVYLWIWSLSDNLRTRAGRFRSGDPIKVRSILVGRLLVPIREIQSS
jgi:hypothetical protein